MLSKNVLEKLYIHHKFSVAQIAKKLECSQGKINYWLAHYQIKKRSISEGVYLSANPSGDPFLFAQPILPTEWFLYGLGLGLYWGEGNKANQSSIRLGNTDPGLVRQFLYFLKNIYGIDQRRLRFGLQIFKDLDAIEVRKYWCRELGVSLHQFQKVAVVSSLRRGTYTHKAAHGVLTVYFSNTKLRASIMAAIEKLQQQRDSFLLPM